jgi:hypothetical protein
MASNLKLVGLETVDYLDIDELVSDLLQPLEGLCLPAVEVRGELVDGLDFISEALYARIDELLE